MVHCADGSAPILAHAHLGKMHENAKKSSSVECNAKGAFTMTVPAPGIYELRVSAVNHTEASIPLIVTEPKKEITLDVMLKANNYDPMPEHVRIIGDWNKFEFAGTDTLAPVQDPNGIYTFVGDRIATADTLAYQLLSVAGNHSVNGSQADYYTYDGGGDYRSVLRTKKGEKVTITYDPAKMQYASSMRLPRIQFNDEFLMKAYALYSTVEQMSEEMIVETNGQRSISGEKYQAMLGYIRTALSGAQASGNTTLAQYAAVVLASQYNPDLPLSKDDAATILATVPANSPMWSLAPHEVIELTSLVEPNQGVAYRTGLESNPERSVRAVALANRLETAYTAKRTEEARTLYTTLKTEYKDIDDIKYEITKFNPDAAVQLGKHVPPFELGLLGEASKVSDKSMLGHYYMIDFWATWCGPCVREMPAIHKAYEKFRGRKGFEILSISMDAAEGQIAPFRAKKWKMPWLHAFIPGIFNADLAKEFEVAGIPRPILVGPDGTIVAMEDSMRGENLEKTLAKFLGEPN